MRSIRATIRRGNTISDADDEDLMYLSTPLPSLPFMVKITGQCDLAEALRSVSSVPADGLL